MATQISFTPYLSWVDATSPNNIPADAKVISATDLLRYENFGVAARDAINALTETATDAGIANLVETDGTLLNTALDATYARGSGDRLISTLTRGVTDATLVLLGDSTANETTEWFYLTLIDLGLQFPNYTITYYLWDDATQAYGAASTIQTGTGRTLTVYNGSVPGSGANYIYGSQAITRMPKMIPVSPTTVIFSYGYNWGAATYRYEILRALRTVRGVHPTSDFIAVSQPPRATTDAGAANHLARVADVRAVAGEEGLGLIDATQAFINYGNYNELISADGIHPLPAGSRVWADEAIRVLNAQPTAVPPRSAPVSGSRVWVPAPQFMSVTGAPALAWVENYPVWSMDPATTEEIGTTVDVPSEWGKCNVYVVWFTSATTGQAVFTPRFGALSTFEGNISGSTTALSAIVGPTNITAASAANLMRFSLVYQWDNATEAGRIRGGRPLVIKLSREGANTSDTLTVDAHVVGIMIERAE